MVPSRIKRWRAELNCELNWDEILTYWLTDILTYWIEWWIEFRRNEHVEKLSLSWIQTLSSGETVVVCYSMIIYWDFNVVRWNDVLHYLLMLSPLLFPLHCMCGVHYFCVRHCLSLLMPSLLWCLELLCLCAWADKSQFSLCFRMGNCIYSEDTVWEPGRPCQRAVYALCHKQSTSFDICI